MNGCCTGAMTQMAWHGAAATRRGGAVARVASAGEAGGPVVGSVRGERQRRVQALARPAASIGLSRLRPGYLVAQLSTVLLECVMVVCGYQLYSTVRALVAGESGTAIGHGAMMLRFERWLHLSFEQPLQQAALRALWLVRLCNYFYVYLYLPFIVCTAVILFLRNRRLYTLTRRTFLISGGIGLLVFARYPVAPPRLLPGEGFVDTIQRFYPQAGYAANHFANQFAAVPSFHFAWTALAAFALWRAFRSVLLRVLVALVPALMLGVIIVTANHLWLDAAIGGLVVWLSARLARLLDRMPVPGLRSACGTGRGGQVDQHRDAVAIREGAVALAARLGVVERYARHGVAGGGEARRDQVARPVELLTDVPARAEHVEVHARQHREAAAVVEGGTVHADVKA